MSEMTTVLRGVVHGKTIELEEEPGLPDGQIVTITVTVPPLAAPRKKLPPGEGIRRSAGAWAEDAEELDQYLEQVRQQRKVGRTGFEP
jgi:hypothetical protein